MVSLVFPVLRLAVAERKIVEGRVICDETTNPAVLVDRNEINAKIFIKPTKTGEFLILDFIVTATSTDFNELLI